MLRTAFTEMMGCEVPIQLAGMGGIGSAELAIAVSQAGAFGMVPGSHPPEALDRLREHTGGAFGVNFLMPFVDRAAVQAAAGKARLVEFFYGDPDRSLVDLVHGS